MMKRILAVVAVLAILLPATVMAGNAGFNSKFTFADVTFSDGTSGVIEAGSKRTNKSDFTTCEYYTDGYLNYLGQYQESGVSSNDAGVIEEFCLDNYVDRTLPK